MKGSARGSHISCLCNDGRKKEFLVLFRTENLFLNKFQAPKKETWKNETFFLPIGEIAYA